MVSEGVWEDGGGEQNLMCAITTVCIILNFRGEVINGGFGLLLDGTEVSAALFNDYNFLYH